MLSASARARKSRFWALRTVISAGVLIAAASSGPAAPSAIGADPPSPQEVALAKATQFRESFGLRSDPAFVEASLSGDGRFDSYPYGLPLREDEIANLQRRLRVQLSLGPASAFAEKQVGYAGMYVDQLDGGRPVFLFPRDDADRDQQLERLAPQDIPIDFRRARFSLSDLEDGKAQILKGMPRFIQDVIRVIEVGPDVEANAVEVIVEDLTPEAKDLIEALEPQFVVLDGSHAVNDACSNIDSCPPAKAGMKIYDANTACAEGPYIRRANGKKVIITASHCLDDGVGLAWFHDGAHVAHSGQNTGTPHKHNAFAADCNPNVATQLGVIWPTPTQACFSSPVP